MNTPMDGESPKPVMGSPRDTPQAGHTPVTPSPEATTPHVPSCPCRDAIHPACAPGRDRKFLGRRKFRPSPHSPPLLLRLPSLPGDRVSCGRPLPPSLGTPVGIKCPVLSSLPHEVSLGAAAHASSQLRRQSVKDEAAAGGSKASPEPEQKEEEDGKPAAAPAEEKSQLRGDWRLYRGHHPLSFLGLEDPLFMRHNLYRSPAFEPECPLPRKSAFAPYNRRVSEGSYRFGPEAMYSRAYYANLYSPAFKKD